MRKFEQKSADILDKGVTASQQVPEDGDDDLVATNVQLNTVDPITKGKIKDPVRNRKCDHVYEKSSILQLMANNAMTKSVTT